MTKKKDVENVPVIAVVDRGQNISTLASKLTQEDVDMIKERMDKVVEDCPGLKMVSELESNNGIEYHEPEEGYEVKAVVTSNTRTGERIVESIIDDDLKEEMTDEDIDRIVSDLAEEEDAEITKEDLLDSIGSDTEIMPGVNLTMEGTMVLLDIVKRVQAGEDFNIYKAFPPEVKKAIDNYMQNVVGSSLSQEAKTIRNTISYTLIHQFITDIKMKKFMSDFQSEMDKVKEELDIEFSKMCLDYNEKRNEYIEKMTSKVTDPEKKAILEQILDSINDSYHLERIKEAARAHKIKIKKFDLEKPSRVINSFHAKYDKSNNNIYSVEYAMNVLLRHTEGMISPKDVVKFLVAFCKFCMNYKAENPVEHAFMYYTTYNIVILDVYKGEDFEEYRDRIVSNIKSVVELL